MIEREAIYARGASFSEIDGVVMFTYRSDASSVIGPRKATKADKEAFQGEWRAFNDGRLPQLDHDGVNGPGGSKPIRPVSDEHRHVPADYEEPQSGGAEPVSDDVIEPPKRRGRPPKG